MWSKAKKYFQNQTFAIGNTFSYVKILLALERVTLSCQMDEKSRPLHDESMVFLQVLRYDRLNYCLAELRCDFKEKSVILVERK